MRIGIDARELARSKHSGKGNYVYNLIRSLIKVDQGNQYVLYTKEDFNIELPPNFSKKVVARPSVLWHRGVIAQKKKDEVDLFLAPTSFIIPAYSDNTVMVIHDLVSFLGITRHQAKAKFTEKRTLPKALRRTKKIVAVSENTKKDLIKTFDVPEEKIKVIYNSDSPHFKEIKDLATIRKVLKKYKLPERFLLFVGKLEPRKNLVNLLKAYSHMESPPPLVVVGGKGWNYKDIFKTVNDLNLGQRVIFTEGINNSDLIYLYNAAEFLVFPSLYEGFGLPALEAMMCGCPVVTSKVASLPEVCGPAALYVNPENLEEMERIMEKVLRNYEMREHMRSAGLKQANKFSQEKLGMSFVKLFKELSNEA